MFSGHGTIETAVAAIKKGAYDFIEKPFKADRLLLADPARAARRAGCKRENAGAASSSRRRGRADRQRRRRSIQVRQAIERVAPTGSRVLISGPPGVGQGGGGAPDPRQLAPRRRRRSWCSTPRPWRRSASRSSCSAARPACWAPTSRASRHLRARPRRHAAARRGGRHAAGDAGQDPARAAGAALLAARRRAPDRGRRAGHRRRPTATSRPRWRPAGSARTCTTASTSCRSGDAAAGRAPGRHPDARPSTSWRAPPRHSGLPPRG